VVVSPKLNRLSGGIVAAARIREMQIHVPAISVGKPLGTPWPATSTNLLGCGPRAEQNSSPLSGVLFGAFHACGAPE
jgi:hypothetical protein